MAITLSTDGYCAATDIAALLQNLTISTTSKPTTAQVEAMISEDFGEINLMLVGENVPAPVAQAGGSLAGGSIVVKTAGVIGQSFVTLEVSGGTLVGVAKEQDFLVFSTDAQRYYIVEDAISASGEVFIEISPALELALPAATAVTYAPAVGAATTLKKYNALMTAIRTSQAAYGPDADVTELIAERDALWERIKRMKLGADEIEEGASGSMKLSRT